MSVLWESVAGVGRQHFACSPGGGKAPRDLVVMSRVTFLYEADFQNVLINDPLQQQWGSEKERYRDGE